MVLTARAENHLYGAGDLDDTITRLLAYRDAGADAAYAPGLSSIDDIARVVSEVGLPVNVLALPDGPDGGRAGADRRAPRVDRRRPGLDRLRALAAAATDLLEHGTTTPVGGRLTPELRTAAFGER